MIILSRFNKAVLGKGLDLCNCLKINKHGFEKNWQNPPFFPMAQVRSHVKTVEVK